MLENSIKKKLIQEIKSIVKEKYVLTTNWNMEPYCRGWRYGGGEALAVVKPGSLIEIWKVLQICTKYNIIIIMQAANTGLTGGSTPYGHDYDRPIIIINNMRVNDIHIIDEGNQIIGFAGSTLYELESELSSYSREPHSVIGSSCIGASIVGGICNNSGGALIKRGPAYTELSLYARLNTNGELILVNELDIDLGSDPISILENLQGKKYNKNQVKFSKKLASDHEYQNRLRDIKANSPARFNADKRRLSGASGCAGKIAVFAVRVDTYPKPKQKKVFYLGSNDSAIFNKIRKHILTKFENLPVSGEYIHRDCYDITKQYSKDTFIVVDRMGASFMPRLFEFKRRIDLFAQKFRLLPNKLSDKLLQFFSYLLPNHLPDRMEQYRNKYEHHWIIEMSDDGILEAKTFFNHFFQKNEGDFFECDQREAEKAILHRFVAASSLPRYKIMNEESTGEMLSLDIALPRNEENWFEELPPEIESLFKIKLYYGHLFCHVIHQNYLLKKGVKAEDVWTKLLKFYDERGAEYPAEHNVGHEYSAKPVLRRFYKKLDPTNSFNPGIGKTSKNKFWK